MDAGTGYVDGNQLGNGEWETSRTNHSTNPTRPSMDASQKMHVDIESKIEEIEIPFRHLSRKRIEAIACMGGLIALSLLPLFTIGGSIGEFLKYMGSNCRQNSSG
jgi:hypothetical protein